MAKKLRGKAGTGISDIRHDLPKKFRVINLAAERTWRKIIDPSVEMDREIYKTVEEAAAATQQLVPKPETSSEYKERHRQDPKLPANPKGYYAKDWERINGWRGFLNSTKAYRLPQRKVSYYSSVREAAAAAQRLGIRRQREYRQQRKTDPRLPPNPHRQYGDEAWVNIGEWPGFLNIPHGRDAGSEQGRR